MSKAILVIDMPEICIDCPLSFFERGTPKLNLVCGPTQEDVNGGDKPDWCPLREVPKPKMYGELQDTNGLKWWGEGYNACLSDILKGGSE